MIKYPRLHELFDINDSSTSIIYSLQSMSEIPFLTSENVEECSLEYYLGHSGNKLISPLVLKLREHDEEHFVSNVASIIYNKFIDKWTREYNALQTDYAPLENYNMEEEEKRDTDLTTATHVTSSDTGSYGFNSAKLVPNTHAQGETEVNISGSGAKNKTSLTRHGNIGVTTSQQMLESEMSLRDKYVFWEMMMKDIDSIVCQKIY